MGRGRGGEGEGEENVVSFLISKEGLFFPFGILFAHAAATTALQSLFLFKFRPMIGWAKAKREGKKHSMRAVVLFVFVNLQK